MEKTGGQNSVKGREIKSHEMDIAYKISLVELIVT
jgi:hypothetical protein